MQRQSVGLTTNHLQRHIRGESLWITEAKDSLRLPQAPSSQGQRFGFVARAWRIDPATGARLGDGKIVARGRPKLGWTKKDA